MKSTVMGSKSNFWKAFGPGIMFAGTCIGGSHLVQSTSAGATYGFDLLYLILLANLLKYPFFEFASRYTNATGESVLEGYQKLGRWTLYLYAGITLLSMFIVTAAIVSLTGGLLNNLLGLDKELEVWSVLGISIIVLMLLATGKFNLLDQMLKIIGIVLVISVVSATLMVLVGGRPSPVNGFVGKETYSLEGFGAMITLMGWMPMGVDMSAWHSIWTQERIKQTKYHPTLKETLADFNIGYFITVFLAICFLTLGAYVLYGSNVQLSPNGAEFSNQLVNMFTETIGSWSYLIIAAAAFSTMFGTSLTLVDGYARSMDRVITLLKRKTENDSKNSSYRSWLLITLVGGLLIVLLGKFVKSAEGLPLLNFRQLIDIATALSFLIAPVAAYLNYKIIYGLPMSAEFVPKKRMKYLAITGIIFLAGFSAAYVYSLVLK